VTLLQNKYGDTPLHVATRVSQQSSSKVRFLMQLEPKALEMKNHVGCTPLGVACISGVWLPVLEMMVDEYPDALMMVDDDGNTPIHLLWLHFLKTVPGALAIRRYVSDGGYGDDCEMPHLLSRFWTKFCYCVMQSHRFKNGLLRNRTSEEEDGCDSREDRDSSSNNGDNGNDHMLCHAILAQSINANQQVDQLLAIAIINDKNLALQTDGDGNNPLHKLASGSDFKSIKVLVDQCREALSRTNDTGRLPLHIALESHPYYHHCNNEEKNDENAEKAIKKWTKKVNYMFKADPDALHLPDLALDSELCGLYPIMVAATFDDVDMTYEMLIRRPEIVDCASA